MRLFAALYPDSGALDHLELALDAIGRGSPGRPGASEPRWTSRELWHVTASFFGDVPDGAVGDLTAALEAVAGSVPRPMLALRGAGVFDRRVLWVGVGGQTDVLQDLSSRTALAATEIGLREDRRPRHRAHLTVARASATGRRAGRRRRSGPTEAEGPALEARAAVLAVYAGPEWTPTHLALVSSERDDSRVVHRVLDRFVLAD
ncbi:RNA 2',3'-cyclic phosphodiesterase [Oerskovia flava]|uniref:RNA 2',3'-cyclic phosphodiesterase n=1 Tax=Oerskovia flava TaxID=2986422 RepID=UPI00223EE3EA|nr:RNA 2',3'-cyclic phosphodiesterase [Oerskovia sp. JB1-3-2]